MLMKINAQSERGASGEGDVGVGRGGRCKRKGK